MKKVNFPNVEYATRQGETVEEAIANLCEAMAPFLNEFPRASL